MFNLLNRRGVGEWSLKMIKTLLTSVVGCALYCEAKGHQFSSRSGHMPVLRVPSPVRAWEATNQCFSLISIFPSLSHSLPLSKKKKKEEEEEEEPWYTLKNSFLENNSLQVSCICYIKCMVIPTTLCTGFCNY